MNATASRLETLPNETLIEIFQYFQIDELFRTFDKLNSRFNTLLRVNNNNLILNLWSYNFTPANSFTPYVDTLVIHYMDVNMTHFQNIRRLKIVRLTQELLNKFNADSLPCLESLFIHKLSSSSADILYSKIFSNTFPCLKHFYMSPHTRIQTVDYFVHHPVLQSLQIGLINLPVYEAILSTCPNLYLFKFSLQFSGTTQIAKPHVNLKRMIIKPEESEQSNINSIIDKCLSFVPNLERLSIRQDFFQMNIPRYFQYDFHASSIAHNLPLIRQFNFYFKSWLNTGVDTQIINTVDELRKRFHLVHNDRYKSKFHFNLTF